MLYVLGSVVMDTRPFNVDDVSRSVSADSATKAVMGGLEPSEFTGEGPDEITLSGSLLPFKTGGLSEFEIADEMRRTGARFPLMRGDGKRLGTYFITKASEQHSELMRNGVGFVVKYSITCRKVPGQYDGAAVVAALLSLFLAVG